MLATATETATEVRGESALRAAGLQATAETVTREQLEQAVKLENEEFSARVRSAEAKEAFTAFLEKRPPNFEND